MNVELGMMAVISAAMILRKSFLSDPRARRPMARSREGSEGDMLRGAIFLDVDSIMTIFPYKYRGCATAILSNDQPQAPLRRGFS